MKDKGEHIAYFEIGCDISGLRPFRKLVRDRSIMLKGNCKHCWCVSFLRRQTVGQGCANQRE